MEKISRHTITIKTRKGDEKEISTATNTEILLDGKLLKGVRAVNYFCDGNSLIGKVTLEMVANVNIENLNFQKENVKIIDKEENHKGTTK